MTVPKRSDHVVGLDWLLVKIRVKIQQQQIRETVDGPL